MSSAGVQANGESAFARISGNGRFVVFQSGGDNLVDGDDNGYADIFLRDLEQGTTTLVSVTNGGLPADSASEVPVITSDGRYVAFASYATNLVGIDMNPGRDIFVRDRVAGTTELVSVTPSGKCGMAP